MLSDQAFKSSVRECDKLVEANDLSGATKAFEKLVETWDDRADAWNCLGYVYLLQERYEDAVQALKTGLGLSPQHMSTRKNLVTAYRRLDLHHCAVSLLTAMIADGPDRDREHFVKLLRYSLAQAYDEKLTRKSLAIIIETLPKDPTVIGMAIQFYEDLKDFKSCIPLYQTLAALDPTNTYAQEKLAFSLFQTVSVDEAQSAFDFLATRLGSSDKKEKRYHEVYNAGLMATNTIPSQSRRFRFRELIRVFEEVFELNGEIAECGMLSGLSAFVLCHTTRDRLGDYSGADFHGFDSFEGLNEPSAEDIAEGSNNRNLRRGAFKSELGTVRNNLHEFPKVSL